MGKRVLLTGGTGFVGQAIVAGLRERGDSVVVITRNAASARARLGHDSAIDIVEGDPCYGGSWQASLRDVNAVIHLAGQSVAGERWSARYKQILHDSRVESTRNLVDAMQSSDARERPTVLVSASGIDYYPFDDDIPGGGDDDIDENQPAGSTFLARLCRDWESEAMRASELGVRVVCMRSGVVLDRGDGGPLDKMTIPFRFFAGGRIGSGKQWLSWIHRDDAAAAYLFAMDRADVSGPLNLVAPSPVRAGDFARALGKVMGRPSWLPVPAFAIRAAVGEFAEHLLHGRRAIPAALVRHGFQFAFPALEPALASIFTVS